VDGDKLVVESGGVSYEYPGLLGLAPEWETQALTPSQAKWVSACLIAHINAVGASVNISARAFGKLTADAAEIQTFPVYEGTFFGDVFGSEQKFYSCQGDSASLAMLQSPDRDKRLCTDDDDTCQVTALGRCRDICGRHDAKYGWTECLAGGVIYSETVSVYLLADDSADTQTCGAGGDCQLDCSGSQCTGHIDCQDTQSCTATCASGAACNVDCNGSDTCSQGTSGGSVMELDCRLTGSCGVTCDGASACEIDCGGSSSCNAVDCTGGAECLLDCTGSASCDFNTCEGVRTYCPDSDVVVCNRACP
jgi:hypothetical protein